MTNYKLLSLPRRTPPVRPLLIEFLLKMRVWWLLMTTSTMSKTHWWPPNQKNNTNTSRNTSSININLCKASRVAAVAAALAAAAKAIAGQKAQTGRSRRMTQKPPLLLPIKIAAMAAVMAVAIKIDELVLKTFLVLSRRPAKVIDLARQPLNDSTLPLKISSTRNLTSTLQLLTVTLNGWSPMQGAVQWK